MPKQLVRRYRRDTNEMAIDFEVFRSRMFSTRIPEGVPYDNEDAERIKQLLREMDPKPDEVQMPIPSGLGDLVHESIYVTFTDDKREDYEVMLDIQECIRNGLRNRAWLA